MSPLCSQGHLSSCTHLSPARAVPGGQWHPSMQASLQTVEPWLPQTELHAGPHSKKTLSLEQFTAKMSRNLTSLLITYLTFANDTSL